MSHSRQFPVVALCLLSLSAIRAPELRADETTANSTQSVTTTVSSGALSVPVQVSGKAPVSAAAAPIDEARTVTGQPWLSGKAAERYRAELSLFGDVAEVRTATAARPLLFLVSDITTDERRNLTEDLQVLDSLLHRALTIRGVRKQVDNVVLGVTLHRSELSGRSTYLEDFGVHFLQYIPNLSLTRDLQKSDKAETEKKKESDWDTARRQLFEGPESTARANQDSSPVHDEAAVDTIVSQVTAVLDNIGRIRFPAHARGTRQNVSVVLVCPADGSTITIRRSVTVAEDPKDSTLHEVKVHHAADPAFALVHPTFGNFYRQFSDHPVPAMTVPGFPIIPPTFESTSPANPEGR